MVCTTSDLRGVCCCVVLTCPLWSNVFYQGFYLTARADIFLLEKREKKSCFRREDELQRCRVGVLKGPCSSCHTAVLLRRPLPTPLTATLRLQLSTLGGEFKVLAGLNGCDLTFPGQSLHSGSVISLSVVNRDHVRYHSI